MRKSLPIQLAPVSQAQQGGELSGTLPIAHFRRFVTELQKEAGHVAVRLRFGRDDVGTHYVTGWISCRVELVCQRCLEAFATPLEATFALGFVENESEADRLPERYDPFILHGKTVVRIVDLLEDELILQLPIVPRHVDRNDCMADMVYKASTDGEKLDYSRSNPFSALKGLV